MRYFEYIFIGRCGREGAMGFSVIYPWFKRAHPKTVQEFKEFCKFETEGCLIENIQSYFPSDGAINISSN